MAVPGVHHMLARPRMLVYVLLGIGRTTATLRSQRVRGLIYSYRRCFDMACMPQNLILFLTVIHSIILHEITSPAQICSCCRWRPHAILGLPLLILPVDSLQSHTHLCPQSHPALRVAPRQRHVRGWPGGSLQPQQLHTGIHSGRKFSILAGADLRSPDLPQNRAYNLPASPLLR